MTCNFYNCRFIVSTSFYSSLYIFIFIKIFFSFESFNSFFIWIEPAFSDLIGSKISVYHLYVLHRGFTQVIYNLSARLKFKLSY